MCSSLMSVLVNGSPSKDFKDGRGLKQGDPLSPFLFVIINEGLKGMVRKALEIHELSAFNIEGRCELSILQFADDALLISNGDWQ